MVISVSDGTWFEDMYDAQMGNVVPYQFASLTQGGSDPGEMLGRSRVKNEIEYERDINEGPSPIERIHEPGTPVPGTQGKVRIAGLRTVPLEHELGEVTEAERRGIQLGRIEQNVNAANTFIGEEQRKETERRELNYLRETTPKEMQVKDFPPRDVPLNQNEGLTLDEEFMRDIPDDWEEVRPVPGGYIVKRDKEELYNLSPRQLMELERKRGLR